MLNFLFFIFIISSFSNGIENTSWIRVDNGIYELRIYSDKYFAISKYNLDSKEFISTMGGSYSLEDGYYEVLEFNSMDSSTVGDTIFYSNIKIKMKNDSGNMKIDGKEFSKNIDKNQLSGSWLMSGIERRGEMRMRDVNRPRKTLNMLCSS